jgi:uncharacterized short protein YbdD (DUF466 family)
MEKLTHWQTLWEQLSKIQSRAFARKKPNQTNGQTHGQEEGQPENQSEDFWKHKARQFDKMVEGRWSKPDSSKDFIIRKLRENPGSTLLDIGAGTGKWSVLASHFMYGVKEFETFVNKMRTTAKYDPSPKKQQFQGKEA